MRKFFNGVCFIALLMAAHLAGAAATPSRSGTTIPSASQIVDYYGNVWTLSSGRALLNNQATPSAGVIRLLCYSGYVYQENAQHNWWVWDRDSAEPVWVASADPRVVTASGATLPAATQIVDSGLNVWTVSGGQAFENGQPTLSSGITLLLYAKGVLYQENVHHNWYEWRNGAWVATPNVTPPSASGTIIPAVPQIIDDQLNTWTVSNGQVFENHAPTQSSSVTQLLFVNGAIYQENVHGNWYQWNGKAWIGSPADPRLGSPKVYVASCSTGPCTPYPANYGYYSVTIIDSVTHRVTGAVPMAFEVQSLLANRDGKQVYAAGLPVTRGGPGTIAVIDTTQEKVVKSIPVSGPVTPVATSLDGSKLYAISFPNTGGTRVSVIDTTANAVVKTLDLPQQFTWSESRVALSPDGKKLYLPGTDSASKSAVIEVIDTASDSFESQFSGSSFNNYSATIITPDNSKLYTVGFYDAAVPPGWFVVVFNPTTGAVMTKIPDAMPWLEVLSPDARHLFGYGLNTIAVIDTATDRTTTAVAGINTGPGDGDFALTPDGQYIYIAAGGYNMVWVADTATYTIWAAVPVAMSGNVAAIAIAPAH